MIYFIEATGTGRVKIGRAIDVNKRLKALDTASPVELRLLKALPGSYAEELELHRRLAEHRVRCEWFDLNAIRHEIESLDAIELQTVGRSTHGNTSVVYLRCPDCGKQREMAARGTKDYPHPVRRCAECSRRINGSKSLSSAEMNEASVGRLRAWRSTHKADVNAAARAAAEARHEADRLCCECGREMKRRHQNMSWQRVVPGQRTCQRCAMKQAWKDPEYQFNRYMSRALKGLAPLSVPVACDCGRRLGKWNTSGKCYMCATKSVPTTPVEQLGG